MEIYYPAAFMILGVVLLILAFYFFARSREAYINNIETNYDIYSMVSTFLGTISVVYGVFIL